MTKRDMQASEYAAESYGKTYRKRCVSHMDGALTDEERERTNHDAAPAARAYADGEPASKCGGEAGLSSRDGTGNTQKPVAWARFFQNGGPQSVYLDRPPADAEPLYRSPTLTDEEREAVYRAEARLRTAYVPDDQTAATLRKLLERTK